MVFLKNSPPQKHSMIIFQEYVANTSATKQKEEFMKYLPPVSNADKEKIWELLS